MINLALLPSICTTVAIASTASTAHAFFSAAAHLPARILIGPSGGGGRDHQPPLLFPIPPPRILLLTRQYATEIDVDDDIAPSKYYIQLGQAIDFQSLLVMDIVLFQRRVTTDQDSSSSNSNTNNSIVLLELGAVQENGNVAPLSTWTLESAYITSTNNEMLQFVVDDADIFPGLSAHEIQVWMVLDGSVMSYGSRQVGGGKGPGNPHGEESELVYYIDRNIVEAKYHARTTLFDDNYVEEFSVNVVVNPKLEHLW